jgi:hypothetical protein
MPTEKPLEQLTAGLFGHTQVIVAHSNHQLPAGTILLFQRG